MSLIILKMALPTTNMTFYRKEKVIFQNIP
jgi:hypothetical protein